MMWFKTAFLWFKANRMICGRFVANQTQQENFDFKIRIKRFKQFFNSNFQANLKVLLESPHEKFDGVRFHKIYLLSI